MCYHVLLKGYIHCQGILTFLTFIGFFSSVDSFMVFKRTGTTQYFRTSFTYTWCLSCMMSFVDLEVTEIIEAFTTSLTFIAFITSVNSIMYLDTFRTFKGFSTLFTLIGLLSIVNAFMNSKMTGIKKNTFSHFWHLYGKSPECVTMFSKSWISQEAFPTFFTFIRFLSSVTLFMYSKKTGRKECFLTFLTFIR